MNKYMMECSRFVAPLRIPALKQPANYDQMLRVIQSFAPGYMRNDVGASETMYLCFAFIFISIAMVLMYLSFSVSIELTRRISKLIRFQKWLLVYTAIPIYSCLMLLSLSLYFGYETGDAIEAIKIAEKWKDTALQRNLYMLDAAYETLDCLSRKVLITNAKELDDEERNIFGITYADIEYSLLKLDVINVDYLPPKTYTESRVLHLNGKLDDHFNLDKIAESMFEPFATKINGTFYDLNLPSIRTIYYTRTIILIITAVTIVYTIFICFMVFLDTNTSYPNVIKIIQFIHPMLFFCIIIEYYLIWNVFSSVVDSYSRYSELIDPRLHSDTELMDDTTKLTFDDFLSSSISITKFHDRDNFKNTTKLNDKLFKLIDPNVFDIYKEEIEQALEIIQELDQSSDWKYYLLKQKFGYGKCKQMKSCMNVDLFLKTAEVSFPIDIPELRWSFETPAISWFRYLIFFNKYTFVPIILPFWKITAMPSIMFFNMMFILLAIPLIKKNSEVTTSDEYI